MADDTGSEHGEQATTQQPGTVPDDQSPKGEWVRRWYGRSPRSAIGIGVGLFVIALVAAIFIVWYVWFTWVPAVSQWAFEPIEWWRVPLAVVALFLLAVLPIAILTYPFMFLNWLLESAFGAGSGQQVDERLEEADRLQKELEDHIVELARTPRHRTVLPLLVSRWSGARLQAYYKIGIHQARRSFRYSVLAMWLGFIILIAGVVIQLVNPLESWGLAPTTTNVNFIVLAAGVIIEFIAALFLWVHRSALENLSRLYDAQMYRHSVILSNLLVSQIETEENRDEARRLIIDRLLMPPHELDIEPATSRSGDLASIANSSTPTLP